MSGIGKCVRCGKTIVDCVDPRTGQIFTSMAEAKAYAGRAGVTCDSCGAKQ